MYYKRYELQWRLSLFFSASILAGGFGGVRSLGWISDNMMLIQIKLLAYALAKMDGMFPGRLGSTRARY